MLKLDFFARQRSRVLPRSCLKTGRAPGLTLFLVVFLLQGAASMLAPCRASAETSPEPATVRLVFDAPVTRAANRDEQRLWVVSRGRLFELDLCADGPREIRFDDANDRGQPRRFHRDADEALMLASLDEADEDEPVLEDFLDDEGLVPKGSARTRRPAASQPRREAVVDVSQDRDGNLWVTTTGSDEGVGRTFRCEATTASCRLRNQHAPREPRETGTAPTSKASPPSPPVALTRADDQPRELAEEIGPVVGHYDVAPGTWLASARGVWFVLRAPAAQTALCAHTTQGGPASAEDTQTVHPLPLPSWSVFLPRLSMVAARATVAPGRSETLLLVLLSFSPRRAVSRGAVAPGLSWPVPAHSLQEILP